MKIKFPVAVKAVEVDREGEEATIKPSSRILSIVAEDFNDVGLADYTHHNEITDCQMLVENGGLFVTAECEKPVEALEYLFGQFSDGWGEGFEQNGIPSGVNKIYVSFTPTWTKAPQSYPYEVLDN